MMRPPKAESSWSLVPACSYCRHTSSPSRSDRGGEDGYEGIRKYIEISGGCSRLMYLVRDEVDGEQKPVTEMKMLLIDKTLLPCSQEETRREKQEGKTCDHHHVCGKRSTPQT